MPAFLRGGGLRLLGVCLCVWALGMLSPRVTPHQAGLVVLGGVVAVLGGAVLLAAGTRRVLRGLRIRIVDHGVDLAEAVLVLVRRIGILILALAFFLFWTLVYLGVWWWRPGSAFTGLERHPYISEFFYYAVSTAFISPPGDIGRDRDRRRAALGLPRVVRRSGRPRASARRRR
jgi:hypothetical protein